MMQGSGAIKNNFVPQYFEIREVGKTIKRYDKIIVNSFLSSKKQYVWRFKLEGQDFTIEMFTSILSGKKKIIRNGEIIFYDKK